MVSISEQNPGVGIGGQVRHRRPRRWSDAQKRYTVAETLDIAVIDVPILRLDHRLDRQRLLETLEHVGPCLVVLDPLVRRKGQTQSED